jgi:hypothetical protein
VSDASHRMSAIQTIGGSQRAGRIVATLYR